jgi:hypothetical protein
VLEEALRSMAVEFALEALFSECQKLAEKGIAQKLPPAMRAERLEATECKRQIDSLLEDKLLSRSAAAPATTGTTSDTLQLIAACAW